MALFGAIAALVGALMMLVGMIALLAIGAVGEVRGARLRRSWRKHGLVTKRLDRTHPAVLTLAEQVSDQRDRQRLLYDVTYRHQFARTRLRWTPAARAAFGAGLALVVAARLPPLDAWYVYGVVIAAVIGAFVSTTVGAAYDTWSSRIAGGTLAQAADAFAGLMDLADAKPASGSWRAVARAKAGHRVAEAYAAASIPTVDIALLASVAPTSDEEWAALQSLAARKLAGAYRGDYAYEAVTAAARSGTSGHWKTAGTVAASFLTLLIAAVSAVAQAWGVWNSSH